MEATHENLVKALDRELSSIISFYLAKEAELLAKLESLDLSIHSLERLPPTSASSFNAGTAPSFSREAGDHSY